MPPRRLGVIVDPELPLGAVDTSALIGHSALADDKPLLAVVLVGEMPLAWPGLVRPVDIGDAAVSSHAVFGVGEPNNLAAPRCDGRLEAWPEGIFGSRFAWPAGVEIGWRLELLFSFNALKSWMGDEGSDRDGAGRIVVGAARQRDETDQGKCWHASDGSHLAMISHIVRDGVSAELPICLASADVKCNYRRGVARTAEQLDGMVVHVRYEVVKLINFVRMSNHWPHAIGLDPELAQFTSESLLEASLIHSRNLIEFLQHKPGKSEVAATDYVVGFELPDEYEVSGRDYGSLSTRLTHIGLDRLSANTDGDFRWDKYFGETVPKVLRGFRYFMRQLNDHYTALFMQPRTDLPWIDVVDGIDFVLGPDDDA